MRLRGATALGRTTVEAEPGRLAFDTIERRLVDWSRAGMPLMVAGPALGAWRAPIDNDVRMAAMWRALHRSSGASTASRPVLARTKSFW